MRIDKARAAAVGVASMDFIWPSQKRASKLGDVIDTIVDGRYYLSNMWRSRVVDSDNPHIACMLCSADGKVHQRGRVYSLESIIGSLTATEYKDPLKVLVDE